jgi:chromosomal replication initiator protein
MLMKEQIATVVCDVCGVTQDQMFSPRRHRKAFMARSLAMYLIRDLLNVSSPFIASFFNRDHSTVLNAMNVVQKNLETSEDYRVMHRKCMEALADLNAKTRMLAQ